MNLDPFYLSVVVCMKSLISLHSIKALKIAFELHIRHNS